MCLAQVTPTGKLAPGETGKQSWSVGILTAAQKGL